MTEKQKKDRQKRSAQLEVKEIAPHTYLVQSQSDPSMYHKVILNGSPSCSCLDWKKNHEADPSWSCKHQEAARALEETRQSAKSNGQANGANGKLSPQEKERLNLEVAVMFGDQAAVDKLNVMNRAAKAQAPQVQALAETGETFEAEPLDACSGCGQLLPASEMIPLDRVQGRLWQAPCGSGLICQECHQAHKEIQSELKALEETPAEPGLLPQPAAHCALCGGELPLAGDPSLSCKSCEYRLR